MNDIQIIAQLRHLVAQFKEDEKQLINAIEKSNGDDPVIERIGNLVLEIKEKMSGYDILRIDDLSLRNDLVAIRENRDSIYFDLLQFIRNRRDPKKIDRLVFGPEWTEFYETRWDDILQDEILSQVDPYSLIIKKIDLGTLLVGRSVPEHLQTHLKKIKDCYTWGFEAVASIYCRTILEEGFREVLKLRPEFKKRPLNEEIEKWNLAWLLKYSKENKCFYREAIDKAYNIKENVNKIVHPSSAREPENALSNLEIIKDTFYIMETLFR